MNKPNTTPMGDKMRQTATLAQPIGPDQLKHFTEILQRYKSGKTRTEQRIVSAENWWKLRNTSEEKKETNIDTQGFTAKSGWLHNVITSKHSDAMEAYPEPNILGREESDKGEAQMLSAIVPCVMEANGFEDTYSQEMWRKLRGGTGAYKVVWDSNKLNGLGDIGIEGVSILNVFWEPEITDIQKSRYFFQTELFDKDLLRELYPEQIKDAELSDTFMATTFALDDTASTKDKVTVIEVYYHKNVAGKNTLQYCKYVNDIVLYSTENDMEPIIDPLTGDQKPPLSVSGLYDHGKYPYVFDALFPIEGSPCGYGYVDICKNPQTEIDILKTAFIKNAMVGAIPRYFGDGSVNEDEFLDLNKPIIHVDSVREDALRKVEHVTLDGSYINMLMQSIQELRETSSNTEASTGTAPGGVTSASGVAALQEASGKVSKDSNRTSYRAYSEIVSLVIELIRQFYDLPRKFRILGEYGTHKYVTYTNAGIKPQRQPNAIDTGARIPQFDIKVSAQKKNTYTKVAQNELSLQFFKMGFFNPQMTDQALMCLSMMDFDGKDEIMQKVAQNGTMFQKLVEYMQMALTLAQSANPQMARQIAQDLANTVGQAGMQNLGAGIPQMLTTDNVEGLPKEEHGIVRNARERANSASQPDGGKVIAND